MAANPFTEKLYGGKYVNAFELAAVLFNKAMMKQHSARIGTETIRQQIIDFETPANRNSYINLDDCVFYYEEYEGIGYWIGTTDIYYDPTNFHYGVNEYSVVRYNEMDNKTRCIIIPIPDVSTTEGSIRTILSFMDVVAAFSHKFNINNAEIIYVAANYFYRVFGINILTEENFDLIFNKSKFVPEFKNFILNTDMKYVKPLDGDLNFYKISGADTRYQESLRYAKRFENTQKFKNSDFSEVEIKYLKDLLDIDSEDVVYENFDYFNFIDRNLADLITSEDYSKIFDEYQISAIMDSVTRFTCRLMSNSMGYIANSTYYDKNINIPEIAKKFLGTVSEKLAKIDRVSWYENGFVSLHDTLIFLYTYLPYMDAKYVEGFLLEHAESTRKCIGDHKDILKGFFTLAFNNCDNHEYFYEGVTGSVIEYIDAHMDEIKEYIYDIYEYLHNCRVNPNEGDDSVDESVSEEET